MKIRRFNIDALIPLLKAGFTLLTPNNRSVDGILREYARTLQSKGGSIRSWERPSVFAIDIYIQQLWRLAASQAIPPFNKIQLLNRFDEQEIWLQIVEASHEKYPLLNSKETAKSAARSYRLYQQWNVAKQINPEDYRNAIDFQAFLEWSKKFEKRCEEIDSLSLSDAGRVIAEHIVDIKSILPDKIALINFNQPPPLYKELFESLGKVCEIEWPHSDQQETRIDTAFSGSDSAVFDFQDSREEVEACINWCHNKAKEFPNSHIGIVLDHNRTLEPTIEETLFKNSEISHSKKFDISEHLNRYQSTDSLKDLPDFNVALALLSLNFDVINSEDFCKLLQLPILDGAEEELQARISLELHLRRNAESETRLTQLRAFMLQEKCDHHCPTLAKILLAFSELARHEPSHQSLRQWLLLFGKQLQVLGWPGKPINEHSKQQSLLWQQCTQHFSSSSQVLGNITLGKALGKLQTFLEQSAINLHFDDRHQISLVDIEEAQDLQFDHLWILSVDEKNWPQTIKPAAFLPYGLQQMLDMPESSNQQQLDAALTKLIQLRKNTQAELVISFHSLEEELSIRPSALLKNITFKSTNIIEVNAEKPPTSLLSNKLERHEEKLHIPLFKDEEVSGGTALLSNQSNCPFRAFARNRLKAKELEEFRQGLNPLVRGYALHKALENLGQHLEDSKTLQSLSDTEIITVIENGTKVAIDYLRKVRPETMTPAFSLLEKSRLTNLLEGFILLEKQRNEFKILHNEKDLTWQHSQLSFNFRIDRIDQLSDGSLAVIDYKSGKYTNYKWFDERPDDLQLPLYQIAVSSQNQQTVSATLIFQLNIENVGLVSPLKLTDFGADIKINSQAKSFEGGWPALQNYWNTIIHSLVDEFESGLVAVAPTRNKDTCNYCDLSSLCRIKETDQGQMFFSEDEL